MTTNARASAIEKLIADGFAVRFEGNNLRADANKLPGTAYPSLTELLDKAREMDEATVVALAEMEAEKPCTIEQLAAVLSRVVGVMVKAKLTTLAEVDPEGVLTPAGAKSNG